ncbi:Phosphoglycerate mutase-like protein [Drosera capensis]
MNIKLKFTFTFQHHHRRIPSTPPPTPAISAGNHLALRRNSLQLSPLSSQNMDYVATPGLYPLHRCKTIHLVRHAHGVHNIEGDKNYKAYMKPEYFDAPLTPLGWQQVENLRKHVHDSGLFKRIELVVTSPLLRTMQTAVGVFGGEGYTDGMTVLPLMGVHPCDQRRRMSEYQYLFPAIDFSQADVRETKAEVAARGLKFMNCFANCELRSMVIADRSMIGTEPSITNYPGKIPYVILYEDPDSDNTGQESSNVIPDAG